MMVWPSGSPFATEAAPIRPPSPRRFSTITVWPRLCCSLSARMRAIVSEALPGVTPDTSLTVWLGKFCCAGAAPGSTAATASAATDTSFDFMPLSLFFYSRLRQAEALREPVRGLAAVAVGAVVRVVPAVLDDQQ